MSSWKDDKDLGSWSFNAQPNKPYYNQGVRIASYTNPVWSVSQAGGPLVTQPHNPWCGYWTKNFSGYAENTPVPETVQGLWGSGSNSQGQLGFGDKVARSGFEEIASGEWLDCDTGAVHSAAIRADGTLWVSGDNFYGQLGLGDNIDRTTLTQVGVETSWVSVACTNYATIAIKSNGTIWATGLNSNSELGLGDTTNRNVFTQSGIATDWEKVACGNQHVIALKTNGSMYSVGDNAQGALGLGDFVDRDEYTFVDSGPWTEISCGSSHTLAIKNDGSLWGCGTAYEGQLGIGTTAREWSLISLTSGSWTAISGGQWHSLAVKSDGTLWCTGDNSEGQLGIGSGTAAVNAWTQVGSESSWSKCFTNYNTSLATYTTGIAYGWGYVWPDIFGTGNVTDYEYEPLAIGDTDAWEMFSSRATGHYIGIKQ